jgi:uncharacterized protein
MENNQSPVIIAAQKYLSVVKGGSIDTWMDIWADDAVVEFPYSPDPFPRLLEGKDAIYAYYKNIAPLFELREENPFVAYLSSDPLVGVVEISLRFFIKSTKKEYNQDYVCIIKVRDDGRIIFYREYSDPVRGQKALLPDEVPAS